MCAGWGRSRREPQENQSKSFRKAKSGFWEKWKSSCSSWARQFCHPEPFPFFRKILHPSKNSGSYLAQAEKKKKLKKKEYIYIINIFKLLNYWIVIYMNIKFIYRYNFFKKFKICFPASLGSRGTLPGKESQQSRGCSWNCFPCLSLDTDGITL